MPLWKTKQLEPFINKLSNRSNYEEVLFVLNELDTVSERQPIILSQFAIYLKSLLEDNDDKIRDYAFNLLMRYLRLNPNEAKHFYKSYKDCLISEKNKIYNSAIKFLSDFILLSSDKSEILIREAIRGSQKHNIDISGKLYESIRLLRLEKYVY
ncbi:Integrator complex subunit 1 [Brachionus plicatilis]|uniref:Integrator complex subunit 1 n=1 Tax=Brachionus plicatilis TaxID=10195 RepID=A0A3M7QTM0_BRAPC|nr:Integrator complex subunit 1 [Brachionus plicatilis]